MTTLPIAPYWYQPKKQGYPLTGKPIVPIMLMLDNLAPMEDLARHSFTLARAPACLCVRKQQWPPEIDIHIDMLYKYGT